MLVGPEEHETVRPTGPQRIMLVQTQAENGGAQEISRLLSKGLEARGYVVQQLFFFRRTESFDNLPNAAFCCLERPSGPWTFMKFLGRLWSEIRKFRPDVLMTFQHYGNFFGVPMAHLAGVRHVIANQNSAPTLMNRMLRLSDKLAGMLGLYHANVSNSCETEQEFSNYPASYRRRVVHVPHGFQDKSTDLSKTEARRLFDLPVDVALMGTVSRLNVLKNIEAPIKSLADLPDVHLAVAGQGCHKAALVELATSVGVADRVHFIGEVASGRVGEFLAALDLFVFPSLAETFGLAGVEAAQAGVPVVANRLPVLEEVLSVDGKPCALFVDASDVPALTNGIRQVLTDEALVRSLVTAGRQLEAKYSLDAMVDGYVQLIDDLERKALRPGKGMSIAKA
ncbi:D-inositol 3-phosphate glycosyltransferase [Hartmannibacter diazotrophicus]|uniref:D-inositol 3-phosphate glycosyltransferase n=1 Tax=Hartmannibacter diazotrophicus TaxID=1482074 RepID=A0A2C9D3F9_9HYPH|nr:glycosyltransferase family 4 protein [Hartmannibacter diazotrophicus]SON54804.1 D-inositol 3-phosphate glycosyltransferase [Hartmannibacter diazotrophicus]